MTFIETIAISIGVYLIFGFIKMKFWDSVKKDEYIWEKLSRGEWYSKQLEIELDDISVMFQGMQKFDIEDYDYPYNEIIKCHKIHIYAVTKLNDLDNNIVLWGEGIMACFLSVSDKLELLKQNNSIDPSSKIEELIQNDIYWQELNTEFVRYEKKIRDVIKKLSNYKK